MPYFRLKLCPDGNQPNAETARFIKHWIPGVERLPCEACLRTTPAPQSAQAEAAYHRVRISGTRSWTKQPRNREIGRLTNLTEHCCLRRGGAYRIHLPDSFQDRIESPLVTLNQLRHASFGLLSRPPPMNPCSAKPTSSYASCLCTLNNFKDEFRKIPEPSPQFTPGVVLTHKSIDFLSSSLLNLNTLTVTSSNRSKPRANNHCTGLPVFHDRAFNTTMSAKYGSAFHHNTFHFRSRLSLPIV